METRSPGLQPLHGQGEALERTLRRLEGSQLFNPTLCCWAGAGGCCRRPCWSGRQRSPTFFWRRILDQDCHLRQDASLLGFSWEDLLPPFASFPASTNLCWVLTVYNKPGDISYVLSGLQCRDPYLASPLGPRVQVTFVGVQGSCRMVAFLFKK